MRHTHTRRQKTHTHTHTDTHARTRTRTARTRTALADQSSLLSSFLRWMLFVLDFYILTLRLSTCQVAWLPFSVQVLGLSLPNPYHDKLERSSLGSAFQNVRSPPAFLSTIVVYILPSLLSTNAAYIRRSRICTTTVFVSEKHCFQDRDNT